MKKRDINLFNKAIHQVKSVINSIHIDREKYYTEISKIREEHDKEMRVRMKTLLQVLDEMQELFDDLYGDISYE